MVVLEIINTPKIMTITWHFDNARDLMFSTGAPESLQVSYQEGRIEYKTCIYEIHLSQ